MQHTRELASLKELRGGECRVLYFLTNENTMR